MKYVAVRRRGPSAAEAAKRRQARAALANAMCAPLLADGEPTDLGVLHELERRYKGRARVRRFRGAGP